MYNASTGVTLIMHYNSSVWGYNDKKNHAELAQNMSTVRNNINLLWCNA